MIIDEHKLRKELTRTMAEAVDETESFEDYFGDSAEGADYGVARADGVMPADIQYLWAYAGQIVDYISQHGVDALDLAEKAGNIFIAYHAIRGMKSDFDESEKEAIQSSVVAKLRNLVDQK
nr:hypothetical protein [uncultured Cohaesibacter sp.]